MTAQYITRRLLVGFSVSLSRMVSYTVIIVLLSATDYAIVGPRDVPECYLPVLKGAPGQVQVEVQNHSLLLLSTALFKASICQDKRKCKA